MDCEAPFIQSDTTSDCTCICEAGCADGEVQDENDCSCSVPPPECNPETDCDGLAADWDMYDSVLDVQANECMCTAAEGQDPCDE